MGRGREPVAAAAEDLAAVHTVEIVEHQDDRFDVVTQLGEQHVHRVEAVGGPFVDRIERLEVLDERFRDEPGRTLADLVLGRDTDRNWAALQRLLD